MSALQFGRLQIAHSPLKYRPSNAAVEAVGIEVFEREEVDDARAAVFPTPDQECAALPAEPTTALTQLLAKPQPNQPGAKSS
ncbi:hypothetical protein [Bradyrhizobium sp. CB3481]|uniref:hypothetical protein n=1 Tax=Bradyrhizobium sp. CB3481 TaxID=3039158 RepID=UPI0024B0CCAB|nr:hypothetical protein [Bradyrhizobium sp. CB3481]WFU16440.1 hypothetical protein QA643_36780 [Bradyrhizobium sp. CB3481]